MGEVILQPIFRATPRQFQSRILKVRHKCLSICMYICICFWYRYYLYACTVYFVYRIPNLANAKLLPTNKKKTLNKKEQTDHCKVNCRVKIV